MSQYISILTVCLFGIRLYMNLPMNDEESPCFWLIYETEFNIDFGFELNYGFQD